MHYGTPMYRRNPDPVKVFVTVEIPGEPPKVKLWQGGSAMAIREAARKFYPSNAELQFGKSW